MNSSCQLLVSIWIYNDQGNANCAGLILMGYYIETLLTGNMMRWWLIMWIELNNQLIKCHRNGLINLTTIRGFQKHESSANQFANKYFHFQPNPLIESEFT